MRIDLKVPMEDVVIAKQRGAQYDAKKGVWFVENPTDLMLYIQWSPEKQQRKTLSLKKPRTDNKPKGIIKKKRVIEVPKQQKPKLKKKVKKQVNVLEQKKKKIKTGLYFYLYRKHLAKKIKKKAQKLNRQLKSD